MTFAKFGVVGGGAWGTALAQTLSAAGSEVVLWANEAETVSAINSDHVNHDFLPDVVLDDRLVATGDVGDLKSCDLILLVAPAQFVRGVCEQLSPHIKPGAPIVVCAKGIEQSSGKQMVDVVAEAIPETEIAVLSGPSFAIDVARGLPAAVTLACRSRQLGERMAAAIGNRQFRIYWSEDIAGVELGGALKNVMAIAAGIVDGKALGTSAHAGLVTRGFSEMRRFAEAYGATPETLMGLSGLGDLILTCGSPKSRNMSLGRALGEGKALDVVLGARKSVTEGVYTAKIVARLARDRKIDMPITFAVAQILAGEVSVDQAIGALMLRPQKAED